MFLLSNKSFLLFLILLGSFCSSCVRQPEDIEVIKNEVTSPPKNLKVEHNTLIFRNYDEFIATINFIEKSSPEDILRWQESINFFSARRYYEMAKKTICCPDEHIDLSTLKATFSGKLIFNDEDNSYSPIIRNTVMNWITNERGSYKIEASYFLIKDNILYSIYDQYNTLHTLPKVDPADFPDIILDQHPISVFAQNSQNIDNRSCYTFGVTSIGAKIDSPINECNSSGCHRTKEAWSEIEDYSSIVGGVNGGSQPVIFFLRACHAKHQRKTLLGWVVCERTTWNWTATHNLTHNIPSSFTPSISIMNSNLSSSSGEECDWNHDLPILSVPLSGPSSMVLPIYNNRSISGPLSFAYTANDCNVVASFSCP